MSIELARQKMPWPRVWVKLGLPDDKGKIASLRPAGLNAGAKIRSPFREDKNPSCVVWMDPDGHGYFKDFGTDETLDDLDMIGRVLALDVKQAVAWYMQQAGVDMPGSKPGPKTQRETKPRPGGGPKAPAKKPEAAMWEGVACHAKGKLVETYDYQGPDGKTRHQTLRYDPKDFRQRRPVRPGEPGDGDGWAWTLDGAALVPYRLPEMLAATQAETVYFVEGEKDVETLRGLGFVATTVAMGAGKWREEYLKWFEGRWVCVIADHDPVKNGKQVGLDGARKIAGEILRVADGVCLLTIPELWAHCPPKADVSDWVTLRRNNGIYDADIREDLIKATNKAGLDEVDVWGGVVSDDTGFCEEEMARRLIRVNELAVVGDTWHQYEAARGMWSPLPHGFAVEKLARRGLVAAGGSALSTARHLSSTMALARSERVWRPEDTDAVPQGWIAVRNGILNVMEGSMVPHHPAWRIVSPVPWDYEPGNDCPAWMDWLEKRQPDQETRNQLQEIAGYCLVNDVNYHAFFFMYGDGGTGKSTFVEVLTELVGQENTVSVQLEELGNPFTRRSLVSKKLFLCKELTHDSFKHVGLVKAITSGDPVYVDVKHREGFSFRPKGRFLMESNVLAATPDSSGGFERRFIQINWDVKIDRGEMNFDFRARFTAEMSGILNWCLEGYRRLVARGRFVHTARSAEASQELLKHRQQVSTWLDSGWIVDNGPGGDGQMTVEEMLENYKEWCLSENVVPFYKEVAPLQREIMTRRPAWKERKARVRQDGDRRWVINGVQAKGSDLWEEMA